MSPDPSTDVSASEGTVRSPAGGNASPGAGGPAPPESRGDREAAASSQGSRPRPYLRIERLTKKFGGFTALDDISLDVYEGEFVCFLGPSGCGKTTLLRAIAGLDVQTAGAVEQAGADISALPPSERDFGIVFQSYALFPNMTVTRNVAYGLESQGRSRAEIRDRVRELLALVGLPDQGDKYPAQLSGGQQQRIALARAIATSPGLLLLDEPLSALDAKVRARLRHEVKALQRRLGVTTIMVTHDQEEALTMADRIVVMNHGVIEQAGAPTEIYGEPASVFVADFIGTMNFIAGEVTGAREVTGGGEVTGSREVTGGAGVTGNGETGGGEVRTGGLVLACDTSGFPEGARVTVAIRPEDIVLDGGEAAGDAIGDAAGDETGDAGTAETGGAIGTAGATTATDRDNAFDPGNAGVSPAGTVAATDRGSPGNGVSRGDTGVPSALVIPVTSEPSFPRKRESMRPGNAGVPPAGTTVPTDRGNVFEATVEYLEFLGSFARAELASAGGRLLMDLPIAQVRRHDVREQSTVRALVPRDAVRIYAEAPPDG